jgi:hypothetical protein
MEALLPHSSSWFSDVVSSSALPKRVREEGSLKTLTLRRNVVAYLWPKLPVAPDDSLKQNRERGSSLDCFAFWAADTEGTRGCRLCRGGRN